MKQSNKSDKDKQKSEEAGEEGRKTEAKAVYKNVKY